MENNRYEEVPQKENVFAKIFKGLGRYFKNVFGAFIDGFKYNNMKLAAILVALPGLLIGFFLVAHAATINQMAFEFQVWSDEYADFFICAFPGMPFDGTAIAVFVLMLFGILNVFNALGMSGKKNLGSVVAATVFTAILVIISAYYVYAVLYYKSIATDGVYIVDAVSKDGFDITVEDTIKIINPNIESFNSNYLVSIISIIVCDIFSVVGVVLGFINYDRTYEKVDR